MSDHANQILMFLSAFPDHEVRQALKQFSLAKKESRTAEGWKIWTGEGYPQKPFVWQQIGQIIYYREPSEEPYLAPWKGQPQPTNLAPKKTASSSAGCQSCSDTAAKRGSISKGLVGLAKAQFGIGRAPDELIANRKAICMNCPANDIGRCAKCGCYIHAKIRIRKEVCPIRRW